MRTEIFMPNNIEIEIVIVLESGVKLVWSPPKKLTNRLPFSIKVRLFEPKAFDIKCKFGSQTENTRSAMAASRAITMNFGIWNIRVNTCMWLRSCTLDFIDSFIQAY